MLQPSFAICILSLLLCCSTSKDTISTSIYILYFRLSFAQSEADKRRFDPISSFMLKRRFDPISSFLVKKSPEYAKRRLDPIGSRLIRSDQSSLDDQEMYQWMQQMSRDQPTRRRNMAENIMNFINPSVLAPGQIDYSEVDFIEKIVNEVLSQLEDRSFVNSVMMDQQVYKRRLDPIGSRMIKRNGLQNDMYMAKRYLDYLSSRMI